MRRWGPWIQAACGWVMLYLAIGGTAGWLVHAGYPVGASCGPFNSVDGGIASRCGQPWVDAFWLVTLGVPRLAMLLPALFATLAGHGLVRGDFRMASNGAPFLVASIPFLLVTWFGARFWWRRRRAFGLGVLALVLGDVAVLAAMA